MTLLVIGSMVAFFVALLAIRFFITYLQRHGFRLFGYYRIIAGAVIIFLIWKGVIHSLKLDGYANSLQKSNSRMGYVRLGKLCL